MEYITQAEAEKIIKALKANSLLGRHLNEKGNEILCNVLKEDSFEYQAELNREVNIYVLDFPYRENIVIRLNPRFVKDIKLNSVSLDRSCFKWYLNK